MKSLAEIDSAITFLAKHGARRTNGAWLSRDCLVLSADPVKAARRLRRLLIENSHRDASGEMRTLHR